MRTVLGVMLWLCLALPSAAQDEVCPIPMGGDDFSAYSIECLLPLTRFEDDPLSTALTLTSAPAAVIRTDEGVRIALQLVAARERGGDVWLIHIAGVTRSSGWLRPSGFNFGSPVKAYDVRRVDADVKCAGPGCQHREQFTVDIGAKGLSELLSGEGDVPFRVYTREGSFDGRISRNVVAAFAKKGMDEGLF